MEITFEQFWAEHFAPRHAALLAEEQAWQEEAFAAQPHTVCGLELRGMTAYDLLLLHGCESPFVVGGLIQPAHIAQFLSLLCEPAPRGWWARLRFFRHVARLPYPEAVREIKAYVARMFASSDLPVSSPSPSSLSPSPAEPASPALNMCFLAPLVLRLAKETGWSESDILSMRLDKLFQYRRAAEAQATGKTGFPKADKLLSEALTAYDTFRQTGQPPALLPSS